MNAQTHTPGPWAVTGQRESARQIVVKASNGRTIALVPFNTEREVDSGSPLTDGSDASLIAAAPELLDALERAEKHVAKVCDETTRRDLPEWFGDLAIIRAAIAKATGAA